MYFQKCICYPVILFVFLYGTVAEAVVPRPFRIGGTVTIDINELTQATDAGYTFVVSRPDGSPFNPVAEDTDGLNSSDFYIIDIPIYDVDEQPGGASTGDLAVIHVYKDGIPLTVTSPLNGEFVVGDSASTYQMNISIVSPSSHPVINSFTATPATINPGDFVTLSWDITGADSVSIDNGFGAVVPPSGCVQDAPANTTSYTLTASNDAGSVVRTVTVTVEPTTQYSLSVTITGQGHVVPAGGTYDAGTAVQLTASADSGWQFSEWSGDLTGSSNPANVTMSANKGVTATFAPMPGPVINSFTATPATINPGDFVTLSWDITGADSASIDNGFGAVVPSSGYVQDAPIITTSYTLTASNDAGSVVRTVTVTVEPTSQYSLSVTITGQGHVTPAGGTYDAGTVVQLTASADSGWQFSEWSGDLTGSSNPANVTMSANKGVTATFAPMPQYSLSVTITGQGHVTPAGGTYDAGTVVQLTASADSGWQFGRWGGDLTGSSNPAHIIMSANKRVTAIFSPMLPVIHSFTATPAAVKSGDSITLLWDITGADSADINPGVGSVSPSNGSIQDAPTRTTPYILTATNDAGSVTTLVTVTVEPCYICNLRVNSGSAYEIVYDGLRAGALAYIDRSYTIADLPAYLEQATYIRTANKDRTSQGDDFLSFDVNQDVTVYIAHDDRSRTRPSWLLNHFTDTGDDLITTAATLSIFAGDFPAGTVTLGGNESRRSSMYIVVITDISTPLQAIDPKPFDYAADISINTILSWADGGGATSYDVYFGIDPDSSEFIGNYKSMIYDPGPLDYEKTYYWRIDARNSVGIAEGDIWQFTTGSVATDLEVSNLTVNSGGAYEIVYDGLRTGALAYTDRSYTVIDLPAYLEAASYIKTANRDKRSNGDDFLSFDVNQDITVYVAYDDRNRTRPSWLLNHFIDTGDDLITTDATLSIFAGDFTAGTVTLGGNESRRWSMYIIAFK